ncbi:hypothetical protein D3C80_1629450 [compost metagenome]
MHHATPRGRPVQPSRLDQVAIAQCIAVIDAGLRIQEQIRDRREARVWMGWKSRPSDPCMIDREEWVDALVGLPAAQGEGAKVATVVHALQTCDGGHD